MQKLCCARTLEDKIIKCKIFVEKFEYKYCVLVFHTAFCVYSHANADLLRFIDGASLLTMIMRGGQVNEENNWDTSIVVSPRIILTS